MSKRNRDKPIPNAADQTFTSPVDAAAEAPPGDLPSNASEQAGGLDQGECDIEAQLAEANERALRAHAELENFRKRVYRQMEDDRKYACLPLIQDLLPVIDNLQRALSASEANGNSTGLRKGVKMVADSLVGMLAKHHCTQIPTEGSSFDPHLHQAIAQFPNENVPKGHVAEVTVVGYQLYDRVVRPAQVLVSAGPADAQTNNPPTESADAN